MKTPGILTLLITDPTACQPFRISDPDEASPVVGIWVYNGWSPADTALVYVPRNQLADQPYGYVFNPDGNMVQRINSGWRGPLPITPAD